MNSERPPHRHRNAVDTVHALRWVVPAVLAYVFVGLGVLALMGRAGDVQLSRVIDATSGTQLVASAVELPRRPHRPVLVLDGTAGGGALSELVAADDLVIDVHISSLSSNYEYGRAVRAHTLICAPSEGALACPFDFFTTDGAGAYDVTLTLRGPADALAPRSPRLRIEPDPGATFAAAVLAGGAWLIALVLGIRAWTMARDGAAKTPSQARVWPGATTAVAPSESRPLS